MNEKINSLDSEQSSFVTAKGKFIKPSLLTISDPAGRTIIEVDCNGIVHVGKDFIDKQPDETAKAILEAINKTMIINGLPFSDERQIKGIYKLGKWECERGEEDA